MRGLLADDPGTQGLIDGILERARTTFHRVHGGPEQAHAHDVGRLPLHIFRPHIDGAAHAQTGGRHSRGHTVLPGAGLGHQSGLAHILGQQRLPQGVVDLVSAGMQQVFTLEPQFKAQFFGKARAEGQGRGPPRIIVQQILQLVLELLRRHDVPHGGFHFQQRRHQQLRNETSPKFAKIAFLHGRSPLYLNCIVFYNFYPSGSPALPGSGRQARLEGSAGASRKISSTRRAISVMARASFCPGASSTPELQSTPSGRHAVSA